MEVSLQPVKEGLGTAVTMGIDSLDLHTDTAKHQVNGVELSQHALVSIP